MTETAAQGNRGIKPYEELARRTGVSPAVRGTGLAGDSRGYTWRAFEVPHSSIAIAGPNFQKKETHDQS